MTYATGTAAMVEKMASTTGIMISDMIPLFLVFIAMAIVIISLSIIKRGMLGFFNYGRKRKR